MRILAAALLSLALQDRAGVFFDAVRFEDAKAESEPAKRVTALLRKKEHWVAAHRAIEARLGPMRDGVALTVTFDYDGDEVAQAASKDATGMIRFNLKKLEEYQRKLDDIERQKKDAAAKGGKLVFRVVPARIDRILWHELTHIFHADYEAPKWFKEGLAQWLCDDPNPLEGFAFARKKVSSIEEPIEEKLHVYARGHLFWSWIDTRGAVKRVVRATVLEGGAWKPSIEKALGLAWPNIEAAEREWSAREVGKIQERQE
ncbi:MAG TPA: hypothetical protein VF950_23405 [Planctomycetota bacterium]